MDRSDDASNTLRLLLVDPAARGAPPFPLNLPVRSVHRMSMVDLVAEIRPNVFPAGADLTLSSYSRVVATVGSGALEFDVDAIRANTEYAPLKYDVPAREVELHAGPNCSLALLLHRDNPLKCSRNGRALLDAVAADVRAELAARGLSAEVTTLFPPFARVVVLVHAMPPPGTPFPVSHFVTRAIPGVRDSKATVWVEVKGLPSPPPSTMDVDIGIPAPASASAPEAMEGDDDDDL